MNPLLDSAVLAHPAGRRRSIGFQRVELAPTVQVAGATVPAVYALECHGCGALFRMGSPHLRAHHETHRRRPLARRVRARLSLAGRAVRRQLTGED